MMCDDEFNRKRILYVEDDRRTRELLHYLLTEEGYDLEMGEEGSEGLEKIEETRVPFDLIITGIAMPGMSGDDMVYFIRKWNKTVPILVISGGRYSRGCELVEAGLAQNCLPKPFKLDDLIVEVNLLLTGSWKN